MSEEEPQESVEEPRADEAGVTGRAKGGKARAERLTPEERREIGKAGARARWSRDVSEAVCGSPDKPLKIGDVEIECYVLDDGTRVLTQATFLEALGRHPKANVRREGGEEPLPAILQGQALLPFITDEIREKSRPITFRPSRGGRASGYNAELLPVVCELYLKLRDSGNLPRNQEHVARQADILIRGLAHVGIIALVDEATGYQEVRARDALAQILEAYVAKELQPWVRTFPEDFYRELFRLRGLEYPNATVRRPLYFGKLTNDVIYKRLAPGVLEELKKETPRDAKGRHTERLHQRLTPDLGHPKLREHLASVVTIMKLSDRWDDFKLRLERIHPAYNETMALPFEEAREDNGTGL